MRKDNRTLVTKFILLGFPIGQKIQYLLFGIFLLVYLLTVGGNMVIITLVKTNSRLHTPMYFFLVNFSIMEIWYVSCTIPKMLQDFLVSSKSISVPGCIAQCYFFFVMGSTENYLLAVMAYDRYLAICNPLHYTTIMTPQFCGFLVASCWVVTLLGNLLPLIFLCGLEFCGSNEIDHFFCDIFPLLKLSCTDTTLIKIYFFISVCTIMFSCIIFTLVSYSNIIFTVLKIPSTLGRKKAFSTCGSHLTVVLVYYGTVIFMYVRPNSRDSLELDRAVSVFYVAFAPLLNPFIYTLRNNEVKGALWKALSSKVVFKAENLFS
ncbi:olfactory receptor 6F1-like [Rhinatrema bivittatum]|uniref:olfactory receptor 6F1-like n=1 Tax=Rhinatrema bivittatum TaxID=194408 RepID=UPI00112E499B|nr:olfactory receptor 6F1-like [Rhinatrema bivittatum]